MTGGLGAIFSDPATGRLADPSKNMSPFGQAPLRRPTQPMTAADAVDPAFRNSTPVPTQPNYAQAPTAGMDNGYRPATQPLEPTNPPTASMGGVSATALMGALQPQMRSPEAEASSLETLRQQMFGNYYREIEGKMGELRSSMTGDLVRSRRLLMERMDELGAGLHRDMVAMRQEMQKELEDLKRDVFSAVMSISALNDKLGLTDSRFRETWMAVTKALTDRIDNQAIGLATSLKGMEARLDQTVEERVDSLVESALNRQVAAWRSRQQQGAETAAA